MSRPRRLDGFSYVGPAQYFLTFCTFERLPVLKDSHLRDQALRQFRLAASVEAFVILAYCLMPDHVHLLVEGTSDCSDFRRFAKMAKQRAGAAYARHSGRPLWQKGYFERVLRPHDNPKSIARYIVENPVRAGLATNPLDYPHVGSDVWGLQALIEGLA